MPNTNAKPPTRGALRTIVIINDRIRVESPDTSVTTPVDLASDLPRRTKPTGNRANPDVISNTPTTCNNSGTIIIKSNLLKILKFYAYIFKLNALNDIAKDEP